MQAEFKVKVKMVYNKPGQLFELLDSSVDDEGYAESESAEEEMEEDEENLQPVAKKIKGKKAAASKTDVNNNWFDNKKLFFCFIEILFSILGVFSLWGFYD